MNRAASAFAAIAIAIGCLAGPARAQFESDDALKELSAQWWQWVWSIPAAQNPVADTTGASCMVGQRGGVWFLAGTFAATPVARSCTVPEGVPLFFPVLNSTWFNTPDCGQGGEDYSVERLRALAAADVNGATGLSVLLDNQAITQLRRVRSVVFPTVLPVGSVFSVLFGDTCLVPGQVYSPSVADGYYVRLRGLSAGQHHLSIRGTSAGDFAVDVFYTLNVTKVTWKD